MTKLKTVEDLREFLRNYPADAKVEINLSEQDNAKNKQLIAGFWTDSPLDKSDKVVLKLISMS